VGLNGIYPVNFYPYNVQIKKKSPTDKVNPDGEQKQASSNNAELSEHSSSPQYQSSIDYTNSNVNISQIVVDFRNTLKAIGASPEINEEVEGYLRLVELQSSKDNPSAKLIRGNLANASSVLDEYIATTLNKPSSVVKNWIEALLMQKVDYKASSVSEPSAYTTEAINKYKPQPLSENQEINPATQVFLNEKSVSKTENISPADAKLVQLYEKASKIADSGNHEKALEVYDKLISFSQKINNTEIESRLHLDKAYIHDESGNYSLALESYNNAAKAAHVAGNQDLQSQAHYNMASIYDDFGKTDAAFSHYFESLGLDGQTENLKAQGITLNDVGNLYSSQYKNEDALEVFKVGYGIAGEAKDDKGKACILSNTAGVMKNLGFDDKALKFYRNSIKLDKEIGNVEGYAKSYELAGEIMLDNSQPQKAANLFRKSLDAAQQIGDTSWSNRILNKLESNTLSY